MLFRGAAHTNPARHVQSNSLARRGIVRRSGKPGKFQAGKVIPEADGPSIAQLVLPTPRQAATGHCRPGLVAVSVFLIAHWIRTNAPGPRSPRRASVPGPLFCACGTWRTSSTTGTIAAANPTRSSIRGSSPIPTHGGRNTNGLPKPWSGSMPATDRTSWPPTRSKAFVALELLRESLNARLPPDAARYGHAAMVELDAGRHIAPGVIARYPVGRRTPRPPATDSSDIVSVNGHELGIIASHWTSQASDRGDDESRGRSSTPGRFMQPIQVQCAQPCRRLSRLR